MPRFYQPDLGANPDSPFARDGSDKLIRRSYWLDMDDRTLVIVMIKGTGANLTNDEKRAHLIDICALLVACLTAVTEGLPSARPLQYLPVVRRQRGCFN